MPAEVAVILAIIIGLIWLVFKILQGIVKFIEETSKSFEESSVRRKRERHERARDKRREYVHFLLPNELDSFEKKLRAARTQFEQAQAVKWEACPPTWVRAEFQRLPTPRKSGSYCAMSIDDINDILTPNATSSTWLAKESELMERQCNYPNAPPVGKQSKFTEFPILSADLKSAIFEFNTAKMTVKDAERYFADDQTKILAYNGRRADLLAQCESLNAAIEAWNRRSRVSWEQYINESKNLERAEKQVFQKASEAYTAACREETSRFKSLLEGFERGQKHSVIERLGFILDGIRFPGSVPHTWEADFDEEQRIAVVDLGLPDVVHQPPFKVVMLKTGGVQKPLNQTEKKELIPTIHPAILMRTAFEIFRNDSSEAIKLLVVNGWVQFDDPATGVNTKAYTASLMVSKEQVINLNLTKIDPMMAFNNLHGKSAGKLVEIVPIEPMLSLNRKDSRFVDAKEILSQLGTETNLAAMNWQDFEHLIRELFEKEFSGRGAEVKITQASRDRGVDAIVFDPDPIHGGKYVIQAKRYTNTVDVSAVRDLCAVVKKEGASRGILVTTSTFGADAYAFANNEPITLLNGAELLGLLKKHGYGFRINLQEARRLI